MGRKLIILGPLPPPFGGVSVYLRSLREHLQHFDVRVWSYAGRVEGDEGVRCFNHRRLGIVPLLLSEGRRARVLDATHFHFEYPNAVLLPLWLASKRLLRIEWFKNVHDATLPARHRQFGPLRRLLFRLAVDSVDGFVVVSEDLRRWLRDEMRVSQPVAVIPGLLPDARRSEGVAAPLSAGAEEALAAYRRRPRRVCSIGAFVSNYGFQHVGDAVERLREKTGEDIGLILLDGSFTRDARYRAETLRGRDWITVIENIPHGSVHQVLEASDAFVRAAGDESYGISRAEAIWCGLPAVATRVGETRGMLLYDFGDQDELVRQLERALFHPPVQDVQYWAERFQQEAEANLRSLKEVLGVSA